MAKNNDNDGRTPYNHMLFKNRQRRGMDGVSHEETYSAFLAEDRKEDDATLNYEKRLEATRSNNGSQQHKVTEKQLETEDIGFLEKRNETVGKSPANHVNILEQVAYNEKVEAMKKSQTDIDNSFWDEYTGTFVPKQGKSKIKENAGLTQLQNKEERFDKTKKDLSNVDGIPKMVMASVKDADAIMFHLFLKAETEKRDLTENEINFINHIEKEKIEILKNGE